jgi:hypothetical protein
MLIANPQLRLTPASALKNGFFADQKPTMENIKIERDEETMTNYPSSPNNQIERRMMNVPF